MNICGKIATFAKPKNVICKAKIKMEKDNKVLLNQLILSYSPLCNRDFTILKHDPIIQEIIETSSLYIIAQRPELRFDNLTFIEDEEAIEFEIRQNENPDFLKCKVPFFQDNIATDRDKDVLLYLGTKDENNFRNGFPYNNVQGFKIYQDKISDDNFLVWFSPEKFLQNFWKGHLEATVKGNIRTFTKYKVHYVGQATKQDIWKRLTGHEKLQDILSLELPITYGSLPTYEIAVLLFEFQENIEIHTFGYDSNVDDMVDAVTGKHRPDQRTIFLDAEKALIKSMQPKYNDELFKSYPRSKDGLHKHGFDTVSFSFIDPITLVYDKGEIEGSDDYFEGDSIIVKNNMTVELYKNPSRK